MCYLRSYYLDVARGSKNRDLRRSQPYLHTTCQCYLHTDPSILGDYTQHRDSGGTLCLMVVAVEGRSFSFRFNFKERLSDVLSATGQQIWCCIQQRAAATALGLILVSQRSYLEVLTSTLTWKCLDLFLDVLTALLHSNISIYLSDFSNTESPMCWTHLERACLSNVAVSCRFLWKGICISSLFMAWHAVSRYLWNLCIL